MLLLIGSLVLLSPTALFPITPVFGAAICGETILSSTNLTSDLSCSGSGLILGADGITLDCAGHSITGTRSSYTGINITSRKDVTLKNCTVSNFESGVRLDSSVSSSLTGNTAFNNTFFGFLIVSGSSNVLTSNTAINNTYSGFLIDSSANALANNTAIGNGISIGDGFSLLSSSANILMANQATGNGNNRNGHGNGFALYQSSSNTLTGNIASGNTEDGFLLSFSSSNNLTNNVSNGNGKFLGSGFGFEGSSSNTLSGNLAVGNTLDGFDLQLLSIGNTLSYNVVKKGPGIFDSTIGFGTSGTANTYFHNKCLGKGVDSSPPGLC